MGLTTATDLMENVVPVLVACVVDGKYVVILQRSSPVYLFTRGHQKEPVNPEAFRFVALPCDLLPDDRFDTRLLTPTEVAQLDKAGDRRWVDVTCYANVVDVDEVCAAIHRKASTGRRYSVAVVS